MNEFEAYSQAFLDEFKSIPNATFHSDIQIVDLRHKGAGRGIIATADIPPDTELFSIPRECVMSVENSNLYKQLPEIFESKSVDINEDEEDDEEENLPKPWLDLILVLIHDYFHYSTSKWRSYWDVLPADFDTLMFWSIEDLNELQASHVRKRIGKESANEMFVKHIIPIINQHEKIFYPDDTRETDMGLLYLAHRMGTLIMSYAFDLEKPTDSSSSSDEEDDDSAQDGWKIDKDPAHVAMGMVPMADILNADAEFNAHLEHSDDKLTMRSIRQIPKGEEILNYYGALPNSEVLRRYGYTSEKHRRYDVVELQWSKTQNVISSLLSPRKTSPSTASEETYILERESGDPDDTGRLVTEAKFKSFPEDLVEDATDEISRVLFPTTKKQTDIQKRKVKKAFLQVMSQVLIDRLGEYSTTLEHDLELLKQHNVLFGRSKMAVDVRVGEKMLLVEAGEVTKLLLSKYDDVDVNDGGNGIKRDDHVNGGPPNKKQKRSR